MGSSSRRKSTKTGKATLNNRPGIGTADQFGTGKMGPKKLAKENREKAAQQAAELSNIRAETESLKRTLGEELAGKKRARQRGREGLLSSASFGMGNQNTLG